MSMRKSKLAIALGLALAGAGVAFSPAKAVNLADDGLGEVALFQYFTVNNGWQTFIRLINTSDDVVPVKVRFREAQNSRDILDFVVVLSPQDMWVGWTSDDAGSTGQPGVVTADRSCLAPDVGFGPDGWQSFTGPDGEPRKYVTFKSRGFEGGADDGGNPEGRLTEGHIEVISLGRVPPALFGVSTLAPAAIHNSQGVPSCIGISQAFTPPARGGSPAALATASLEFLEPNNSLAANGYMFNLESGQGAGYDPVMLANFYNPIQIDDSSPALLGELIQSFEDFESLEEWAENGFTNPLIAAMQDPTKPDLNSAFPQVSHVRVDTPFSILGILDNILLGGNVIDPVPGPTIVVDEWDRGVDAVSAVLTRKSVINEWAARNTPGEPIEQYQTEWVVNFPTKHYYTDRGDGDNGQFIRPTLPAGPALAPFTHVFQNDVDGGGLSCEAVAVENYDREERFNLFVSPTPSQEYELCFETNVVTFRGDGLAAEGVPSRLGSNVVLDIPQDSLPVPLVDGQWYGWSRMEFIGVNAERGLGADAAADQVYNNIDLIYNMGELGADGQPVLGGAIDAQGLCVPPFPPGKSRSNPPTLIDRDVPVAGSTVPDPDGFDGASGRLPNTLLLTGMFMRPYLTQPVDVQVVDAGACDDPETEVSEARNAIYRVSNTVTYAGLPVTGFSFNLYKAPESENSYAAIVEHKYERQVQIEADVENLFEAVVPAQYNFEVDPPRWESAFPNDG